MAITDKTQWLLMILIGFIVFAALLGLTGCVQTNDICAVLRAGGYVVQQSEYTVDVYTASKALFAADVDARAIQSKCR